MSLLSRNELSVVLYPEQIAFLHTGRELTLRGYKNETHTDKTIPCEIAAESEMPWQNAIRTLEAALPSIIHGKPAVSVTLSNHFMRYLLVPWLDKMSDEEEMAFARHCFRETYGNATDSWSVRISPGRAGVATLASAVDTRLLEELRESVVRQGLNIKSIQPHLMAAFNSCRPSLEGRSSWLALLEPGSLCLAALRKGQLSWIRTLRIGDAWNEELSTILQREAYLTDTGVDLDEVFLWAPHFEALDIQTVGRWKLERFRPGENPSHKLAYGFLKTLAVEH
ncbi:hypothetical protein GALL_30640 [mine drainage metagenome]|uniref:Uncharacterized protein n=1 Tax=mine drainage metagenome TaxID=410659 RepID=A0A1J5TW94_9ZZZZ